MTADTPYTTADAGSNHVAVEQGDAFGQMLADAHRAGAGGTVFEVTERDDGLVSVRDASYYFAPVQLDTHDARLLSTVEGRVLDVGCGAGRHLQFLATQGIRGTGIDVSAGAAQVCATRGLDAVCGNIFDPPPIGRFSAFLLLGGNLGLLGSPQHASRLLRALADVAEPNARILAEGLDLTTTSDPVHLAYQQHNLARGGHRTQVRMRIRYRNLATGWTDLWFCPPTELAAVVSSSGWRLSTLDDSGAGPGYRAELVLDQP